jgi:hypothetical protein
MAERKEWRSIPKKPREGVGAGIKQGLTVIAKAIITSAGLAGLRWIQEHPQEISQGVRRGALCWGRRAKHFANRPMQGLQAVKNRKRRETPSSDGLVRS